ncbi:MAG: chemotaxis protein CheX, partial [Planctomycetota bacterium]|nr:chemotaxis protein CheX [Planctomycetota bacterium]
RNIEGDTILSLITFKGDLEGCLGIYCNLSCAKAIALNMLGMEPTEELDIAEIRDAIGEVANMVMGSVKTRLQETITNIEVSIPTVIRGQKLDNSLGDDTNEASVNLNIADEYSTEFSLQYRES